MFYLTVLLNRNQFLILFASNILIATIIAMPPKKSTPPKKSRPAKKPKRPKNWSMYPSLHDDVSDLLREDNLSFRFHEQDHDKSCINDYDTNIMGRFTCRNP